MSGYNAHLGLPVSERPPGLVPDGPGANPPGEAETAATNEGAAYPSRGGHSEEYEVALAASVLVLRAALDAHLTLLSLDPDNCRSRIANRYASATLLRAVELVSASARALDRKIELALRP